MDLDWTAIGTAAVVAGGLGAARYCLALVGSARMAEIGLGEDLRRRALYLILIGGIRGRFAE